MDNSRQPVTTAKFLIVVNLGIVHVLKLMQLNNQHPLTISYLNLCIPEEIVCVCLKKRERKKRNMDIARKQIIYSEMHFQVVKPKENLSLSHARTCVLCCYSIGKSRFCGLHHSGSQPFNHVKHISFFAQKSVKLLLPTYHYVLKPMMCIALDSASAYIYTCCCTLPYFKTNSSFPSYMFV